MSGRVTMAGDHQPRAIQNVSNGNLSRRSSRSRSRSSGPAVSRIVRNAAISTTCPICKEVFNDPRILPCGHSFCANCLTPIVPLKECSICRKQHHYHVISDVPNNYALATLADDVSKLNLSDYEGEETDFQVFVKDLNDRIITIQTSPTEKVSNFRILIQNLAGDVFDNSMRLLFGGKQLKNGSTLAEYNIQNESTVYMVTNMKGG